MPSAPVSHGIPVISSRQWTTGISPNAAGDGFNYIVASYNLHDTNPVEWVVLKDLTGVPSAPSQTIYQTLSGMYPDTLFQYTTQLRAGNGKIFFPCNQLYTVIYDPTTEAVTQIGPIVETPPVVPHQSTAFYQASFDTAGQLYFTTQESNNRPSCIVRTDPTTLTQTILGYVGDSAVGYTTYGYRIAPDTITAAKFIYVVYGEDPWQLWALNVSTGIATKLYEVSSTGNISFQNIVGQGWIAKISDGTNWWCLDGALYAYTTGQPPPSGAPATRNVTPASNPVAGRPNLDISGGIGVVGWRAGSSGPYAYVNYTVSFASPIPIESLVASNNGILGNAQQYEGFFQYYEPADTHTWFGPASGLVSGGPRINIDGTVYFTGYPNGPLYKYNPDAAWQSSVNPLLLGNYGPNGTQLAGIKYADFLAWAPLAGALGTLYCVGSRERNGVGSGIGAWDKSTLLFAGTYSAAGMDTVLPDGLCVLGGISRVVMSSRLITPPGTANLLVFDYGLNLVASLPVIAGLTALGPIFETSTPNVITGIVQGSGNSLGLWQYNVATHTFIQYVELPIVGALGTKCQQFGGAVWLMSGNNLVRVDISALTAVVEEDLTSIAPVVRMAFASDAHTIFLAANTNSGVAGAEVFSIDTGSNLATGTFVGTGTIFDATLLSDGSVVLVASELTGVGILNPVAFHRDVDVDPNTGDNVITLFNDEGGAITRGQPMFSDGGNTIRLACANASSESIVVGLVAQDSIQAQDFGFISLAGVVVASPDQWDAVCGTVGGLVNKTVYYLHPSIPGRLVSPAPSGSGQEIVPVIKAMSPTEAVICIRPPILL